MKSSDPYFQSKDLSQSAIGLLLECSALYKVWQDDTEERKETEALLFGRMFHKLTLEPKDFGNEFAVKGLNLSTKPGKEWKSGLAKGVSIVKEDDYGTALQMAEAVRDHPQAKYLFKDYVAEQPIYWTRPDGIKCKAKPDMKSMVSGFRYCVDVKTTESVNPAAIQRSIAKYHYYRQAAWYLDGLERVGNPCEAFLFIFVEKTYPYLVTMCQLDEEALAKGREDCERAVEILRNCRRTGLYPCYTRNIETISLPRWAV